jgi:purine-nucleoside phosphorylase
MDMSFFDKAASILPDSCFKEQVELGLMLGSGWDIGIFEEEIVARLDYADIPGLGATGVKGHKGELVVFKREGKMMVAWRGRRHYYEGVGWESVVLPVEILRRMGCRKLLLTNASGGINPALRPGDFVVLRDHINVVGFNPLIGEHRSEWGERFPDMTQVYSRRLIELLHAGASRLSLRVMDGVYAFTAGPCYETPAEINAYKAQGADVVGMSTVPEAVFAHACGMETAGISFVSNLASGIGRSHLSHEEVISSGANAKPVMAAIINDFISRI